MQLNRHRTRLAAVALAGAGLIVTATSPAIAVDKEGTSPSDPPVSTYGSGDWDYLGWDVFTEQSRNFNSGGGDFRICLGSSNDYGTFDLYEEDPYNADDHVRLNDGLYGPFEFPDDFDLAGCYTFRGISEYVDGANGQAEFYVAGYAGGNWEVVAWD